MPTKLNPWEVFDDIRNRVFDKLPFLSNPAGRDASPKFLRESAVESLCLHLRELVDILLSKGKETDDIA